MTYRIWANGLELAFYDLRIRDAIGQFSKTTFLVENTSAVKAACARGKVIWILDDANLKFVGEITTSDEDQQRGLLTVNALDISYRLYTRNSGERKEWNNQTLAMVVSQHVVPVTGKAKQFGYSVLSMSDVTWRNEYGNAITSLANLAQHFKADWYSDAGNPEYGTVSSVNSQTAFSDGSKTFASTGNGVQESFVYVYTGTAAGRGGMVSSNTSNQLTCTNATWQTWGLQAGDLYKMWRVDGGAPATGTGFRFRIVQRRGSGSSTETIDLREDRADGGARKPEKVRNVIYILGKGDGNSQVYTKSFHATTIRSKLATAVNAAATTLALSDASDFPASGTVICGWEKISYTGKSGNSLTGCTRGVGAATGSPEWLAAYAHVVGVEVYLYVTGATTYNETNPQSGSSIQKYGIREFPKAYLNIDDQNALDLMAQQKLAQYIEDRDEGRYKLVRLLATAVLGDTITITDFNGVSTTQRLMAIEYDWKTHTHTIETIQTVAADLSTESIGLIDDGITTTIADIKDELNADAIFDQGLAGGSGTLNYVPKLQANRTYGDSRIQDDGTDVTIHLGATGKLILSRT